MTQTNNLPEPLAQTHPAPQRADAYRLISVYLRTLTSPQTIKTYNTELRMFVSYLEGEIGKGLGELTAEDISLYREHLIKTYTAATAASSMERVPAEAEAVSAISAKLRIEKSSSCSPVSTKPKLA